MCAVLRLELARSDSLGRRRRAMATRRNLLVVPLNPMRTCRIGNTSQQKQLCRVIRAVWRGKRQVRNRGRCWERRRRVDSRWTVARASNFQGCHACRGCPASSWPSFQLVSLRLALSLFPLPLSFCSSPSPTIPHPLHLHLLACVSTLSVRHTPRHTVLNTNS